MSNYIIVTLDTTGPSNPTIVLNGGDTYATNQLVTAAIGTSDAATVGYQMKIWGNVDVAHNPGIQTSEGASSWMTFNVSQEVKLAALDGTKNIYVKIRDDVHNESSQTSDSITLNTAVPVVNIVGPSVPKISKITGRNETTFSFTSDVVFDEYKVKVVSGGSSTHSTGTLIPVTSGSTNMSGAAGGYAAGTPINSAIRGADFEAASAGDGDKYIKVFVKTAAGIWSV